MTANFIFDSYKVYRLAATRQGRVSLGGFAYQIAYAVARMASLYTRRPLLIPEVPHVLRFDWAEDLDEIVDDGSTILTQCKMISDIGQPGQLADVLISLAPKWLWSRSHERRQELKFRLICTDPRFAAVGPIPLSTFRPESGYRDSVLSAAMAQLRTPLRPHSDRAVWQPEAESVGLERLCNEVWDRTEALFQGAGVLTDDPAGPLFPMEREALALLVRLQVVKPDRQLQALAALRALLHGNVIQFLPGSTATIPMLSREPQIIGFDDIHYTLFEFQNASDKPLRFQVITRQFLEREALEPKQAFVARRPRWADVVHGENEEIRFLERQTTAQLIDQVRTEVLGRLGKFEALPILFVLGAPGAGKSTLVLRVVTRLIQEGFAIGAAPKLNLDRVEEDEIEPFIQELSRLEQGSLPVILVLDDPFFADSGWDRLLKRLSSRSSRVAVLGASPELLFREFGYTLVAGRQIELKTVYLPRPEKKERQDLARLHGREVYSFDEREEEFLVLAMEASSAVSFKTIINRIWITLNRGLPFDPNLHPEDLPWQVRAYLLVCYFNQYYLRCSEVLIEAVLSNTGKEKPPGGFAYELRRLVDEQGWSIFSVTELTDWQRFLRCQIGAAHARIASEAWRLRPAPALDIDAWILAASIEAQAAATEIGRIALLLGRERASSGRSLLDNLAVLWNRAAAEGRIEARYIYLLQEAFLQSEPGAARKLRAGFKECVMRRDEQSWLAFLALANDLGSAQTAIDWLGSSLNTLDLIRSSDFHIAPYRAEKFLESMESQPIYRSAIVSRILETNTPYRSPRLLSTLLKKNPKSESVQLCAMEWIEGNPNDPAAIWLFRILLRERPGDKTLQRLALEWVQENPRHYKATSVVEALIKAEPLDVDYNASILQWIQSSNQHHNPGLLVAIAKCGPKCAPLWESALQWLADNASRTKAASVLKVYLKWHCNNEAICKAVIEFLNANISHPESEGLRKALMKAALNSEAVQSYIMESLCTNPNHPVGPQLEQAVLQRRSNSAARSLVISWARRNPNDASVHRLAMDILESDGEGEELQLSTLKWLEYNIDHPVSSILLSSLIASCKGSEAVLSFGEDYIKSNFDSRVLRQLAEATDGRRQLDIAYEFLDRAPKELRRYFLRRISEASFQDQLALLARTAHGNVRVKGALFRSIAMSIARSPNVAGQVLQGLGASLSDEDSNWFIVHLLDLRIDSGEVFCFMARKLAANYRGRGYRVACRAVRRNLAALAAILEVPDLDSRVRRDLDLNSGLNRREKRRAYRRRKRMGRA